MAKAIGTRLIDCGLESWPSHIFSFQKEQKNEWKYDELEGFSKSQPTLEGSIKEYMGFEVTFFVGLDLKKFTR